ncbi:MAG: hypothetical protein FWG36_11020, partial [Oscillospiraceae bacterium]|nr:hypothetical protein [Oscillospiraceae bacterium]
PEAKRFRKWVTSEVLPAIRKNGFYVHPSLMNRAEAKRLLKSMCGGLDKYVYEEDVMKMSKKFGVQRCYVHDVIGGTSENNAIMQECQRRALFNKERELNAYSPDRVREVAEKLNR